MTCTVCAHSGLKTINQGIMTGAGIKPLAAEYALSRQALMRHRDTCLVAPQIKAHVEHRAVMVAQESKAMDLRAALSELHDMSMIAVSKAKEQLSHIEKGVDRERTLSAVEQLSRIVTNAAGVMQRSTALAIFAQSQAPPETKIIYEVTTIGVCPNCTCPSCQGAFPLSAAP